MNRREFMKKSLVVVLSLAPSNEKGYYLENVIRDNNKFYADIMKDGKPTWFVIEDIDHKRPNFPDGTKYIITDKVATAILIGCITDTGVINTYVEKGSTYHEGLKREIESKLERGLLESGEHDFNMVLEYAKDLRKNYCFIDDKLVKR